MSPVDPYKAAYERERAARLEAETLLEDKTRALYDKVVELERTLSHLKTVQAQLLQSEKMASIGQLAAGVAHEINNPVGFSIANVQTLKEYVTPLLALDDWVCDLLKGDEVRLSAYRAKAEETDLEYIKQDAPNLLDETQDGLNRVKDIVAGLKKISHTGTGEVLLCDMNECINDALKIVWNELKYTMQVFKELNTVPPVKAQANEVQQVLINMFINAAHACEEQGELRICSFPVQDDEGDFVEVCVCDNGKGMEKSVLKRIFDPFFTTKPVGVGTGLGLSVSRGIIDKFGGSLRVNSEVGKGTHFTIRLPLAEPLADSTVKPKCAYCQMSKRAKCR